MRNCKTGIIVNSLTSENDSSTTKRSDAELSHQRAIFRMWRRACGFPTQREAAENVHCSERSYQRYENGEREAGFRVLLRMGVVVMRRRTDAA